MQHRRMLYDDEKGVVEPLNETYRVGDDGLQVNARYHMQIFDKKKG